MTGGKDGLNEKTDGKKESERVHDGESDDGMMQRRTRMMMVTIMRTVFWGLVLGTKWAFFSFDIISDYYFNILFGFLDF